MRKLTFFLALIAAGCSKEKATVYQSVPINNIDFSSFQNLTSMNCTYTYMTTPPVTDQSLQNILCTDVDSSFQQGRPGECDSDNTALPGAMHAFADTQLLSVKIYQCAEMFSALHCTYYVHDSAPVDEEIKCD